MKTVATWASVDFNDALPEMGEWDGQGKRLTSGLEITSNGGSRNSSTVIDALTFAKMDDLMYSKSPEEDPNCTRETDARYFSAWVRPTVDLWFDVGVSFNAAPGTANVYWDLGRKFFAPADEWTEIGAITEKDNEGNIISRTYLPFRSQITDEGRGLGEAISPQNSNSATAATNAKEETGDTILQKIWRENWDTQNLNTWGCMRIHAWAATNTAIDNVTGVGFSPSHGIPADESYVITGVNVWSYGSVSEFVQGANYILLDKSAHTMKVGEEVTVTATASPDVALIDESWGGLGLSWNNLFVEIISGVTPIPGTTGQGHITPDANGNFRVVIKAIGVGPAGTSVANISFWDTAFYADSVTFVLTVNAADNGGGNDGCKSGVIAGGGGGSWIIPLGLVLLAGVFMAYSKANSRRRGRAI
jgi:hypothetical protein